MPRLRASKLFDMMLPCAQPPPHILPLSAYIRHRLIVRKMLPSTPYTQAAPAEACRFRRRRVPRDAEAEAAVAMICHYSDAPPERVRLSAYAARLI